MSEYGKIVFMFDRLEYQRRWRAENKEKTKQYRDRQYLKNRDRVLQRQKAYRAENKEKVARQSKDRYAANPDKFIAAARKYQTNNPEKVKASKLAEYNRNKDYYYGKSKAQREKLNEKYGSMNLHYRYGITSAKKEEFLRNQGTVCRCCGSDSPKSVVGWVVDHDPGTTRRDGIVIRGILCWHCNATLGKLGDNKEKIEDFQKRVNVFISEVTSNTAGILARTDLSGTVGGKNAYYLRSYGITEKNYQDMVQAQDGKCGICGRIPKSGPLRVDHCHATGTVRGLLCTGCNTTLGWLGDVESEMNESFYKFLSYLGLTPLPT